MARRNPKRPAAFYKVNPAQRPGINHVKQALRTPLAEGDPRLEQLLQSIKLGVLSTAVLAKLYGTSSNQVRRLRDTGCAYNNLAMKNGKTLRII